MLFKKSTKSFLEKPIGGFETPTPRSVATAFAPPPAATISPLDSFSIEQELSTSKADPEELPDAYVGPGVSLQGELEFPNLLHVDGKFEGKINSSGRIVVGPEGHVKADLRLAEAFISGKIEGDIFVKERLVLRGRAEVYGNITAPIVSVDEGVTIVGQLCVSTKNSAATSST